ncbi:MAG: hypothetical protein PHR16_13425 [Methylovulum sp.]|nr:hypothetical protein [Methylovulum sp.]
MKLLPTLIMVSALFVTTAAEAGYVTDQRIVDVACAREARRAHCGGAQVGSGLLMCLQANRYVRLSNACRAAIGQYQSYMPRPIVTNPIMVVRPAYPIPAPGYLWRQHPGYGWGWYHPRFGWHRDRD